MKKILDLTCLNAEYTRKLNEIATNHKKEYTEFVDKYSRKYGSHYLWWALPFSSRNTYLDETFQNICYLYLCQWAIRNDDEVACIVFDNKALKDVVANIFKQELVSRKIALEYHGKKVRLPGMLVTMFRRFISQIKEYMRIKKYGGRVKYNVESSITLIDTPVLSSCFCNGKYEDRYFNNIQDYVKHNIYFIPSLIKNSKTNWADFIHEVKESTDYNFIFKQNFIKLFDYFYILHYFLFCFLLSFQKYEYDNMNITPLIRNSLLNGCASTPSLKGIINYRFVKRLYQSGIRVENLISWYEGRPSEIMLQTAFRKYYPNDKCVGYIGYPYSEFALSQYISEEQYKQKASPLKMTVPGVVYERQAKQFCEAVELVRVPILRNKYRYNVEKASLLSRKQIFVVLPYFENTARNMLYILNEYMKTHQEDYDVVIKNHPVHEGKTVGQYLPEKLYFYPRYVKGDLVDCIADADVAFISYSTASLEVISQGVFLVNLCPMGKLSDTAIPESIDDTVYRIVYNEQETFEAFDFVLQKEKELSNKLGIDDLLEPINEETVNRMWN